jgi:hypothetical protein
MDLRRDHPELRSESLGFLETSHADHVLAYVRPGAQAGDDIFVLLNYQPTAVRATLPASALRGTTSLVDLMSGDTIPITSETPAVDLLPWGARVLRRGAGDAAR